jgi:FkbM family methyltransferase
MSNVVELPNLQSITETPLVGNSSKRLYNYLCRLLNIKDNYPLNITPLLDGTSIKVIDVGASIGFHKRWEQLGDKLRIFLFEPDKDEYEKLVRLYDKDGRVKLFNVALSEDGKDLLLHVNTWVYSSSVYKHDQDFFSNLNMKNFYQPLKTVKLNSKRLIDVIQDDIDFIKLDVEGIELPVLRGSSVILDKCIGIESEVSYIKWAKDLPLFGDVDSYLQSKGFHLSRLVNPGTYHYILPTSKLESQGIPFSGDVLYFRDPYSVVELVKRGEWDISKVTNAIGLYLVYGHVEFAYILTEEAVKHLWIDNKSLKYSIVQDLIEQRSGRQMTRYKRWIHRKLRRIFKIPDLREPLDY